MHKLFSSLERFGQRCSIELERFLTRVKIIRRTFIL